MIYTTKQAAAALGVSKQWIDHLCDTGQLAFTMHGRDRAFTQQEMAIKEAARKRKLITRRVKQMANETINWRNLIVTNSDNETVDTLGGLVFNDPDGYINETLCLNDNESIREWRGVFISAPGENPDADTPIVPDVLRC